MIDGRLRVTPVLPGLRARLCCTSAGQGPPGEAEVPRDGRGGGVVAYGDPAWSPGCRGLTSSVRRMSGAVVKAGLVLIATLPGAGRPAVEDVPSRVGRAGARSAETAMIPGVAQLVVETILSKERAAMERWRHGDPMGWAEISAGEITYVDPGLTEPIRGLGAYRRWLETSVGKVRYDLSEFIDPRVAVFGWMAVLSYNYVSTLLGASGEVVDRTPWNSTEVYALLDGDWKIVHTHWSYVHERLPETTGARPPVEVRRTEPHGLLAVLLSLEAAAMEHWRRGDPGAFLGLRAEDVTHFDPGTGRRINGLDRLRAEWAERAGQPDGDVVAIVDPRIQLHGDAAVLYYRFLSTVLESRGTLAPATPWNCTEVFVRRRGKWKIVHTHWSYVLGRRP
jgi:ketosteroid isomerase-like protein